MNQPISSTAITINSSDAKTCDVFEIISCSFKPGLSTELQRTAMASLNEVVTGLPGFKSRDFYYQEADNRWIDFLVWDDMQSAQSASEKVMSNPKAGEVFVLIDESTVIMSHYQHLGGTDQSR